MPFTRISLRAGKSPAYHEALTRGVYDAMRETFDVPENDYFAVVHEHEGATFAYDPSYFGIRRDDDLVYIQFTARAGRSTAQKKALFAAIAENLSREPGLRKENVFINIIEVTKEDWSFGNGEMQYASPEG